GSPRPRPRGASLDRTPPSEPRPGRPSRGGLGRRGRDLQGQGHPLGPLGNRRPAGALRLGHLPADGPGLPARVDRRPDPRGRDSGHPWRQARLRHGRHRGARPRARPDRPADRLHLRRQRPADRGPRAGVRPRSPPRSLPGRPPPLRPLPDRPRHRAPLRRLGGGRVPAHRQPPGFRDAPAAGHDPRRLGSGRPLRGHGRQDRRHLRPSRHRARAAPERQRGLPPCCARRLPRLARWRPGLRQPGRLRFRVRPPPRRAGLRRRAGSLRRAPASDPRRPSTGRPLPRHRGPRQRPDLAGHRSHARASPDPGLWACNRPRPDRPARELGRYRGERDEASRRPVARRRHALAL
ncbi:MAG: Phosphopentomutase, partial [uncultured Thermomicrobiales bacterium]